MLQPENQPKKYQHLFTGIDTGKIRIPQFQREFVWSKEQTAKLIDSIIKGYPIGTFILWETSETLPTVRNIGNAKLPELKAGETVQYVLDGQQRITSLYAVQKGLIHKRDGVQADYKDICIDLDLDPDTDDQIVLTSTPEKGHSISVNQVLTGALTDLVTDYPDREHLRKIDIYRNRLTGYDFSTILMAGYNIDVACEVFTRINTAGTELSLFEIMVAKTYDPSKNFDLAQEYKLLLDNNGASGKDLEDAGFETLPAAIVLQCVAAHLKQMIRRQDILKLDKDQFIEAWPTVKEGLFAAVDYVSTHLRIPVSQLLPYYALLISFCYFFIRNGGRKPDASQDRWLQQYFWWVSLSNRYSSATESKIAADLKRMDDILQQKAPDYQGEQLVLTADQLKWRWFSASDSFCKAILCLYAYFEPKSFDNNSVVKIDNSWLRRANSLNYHHFFPRAFLKKRGSEDWQANSVVNITIVDDYLNKRSIGARPPSNYIRAFSAKNPTLASTMRTHLIDDLDQFGIWTDDYETFIDKRTSRLLEEINSRLHPEILDGLAATKQEEVQV